MPPIYLLPSYFYPFISLLIDQFSIHKSTIHPSNHLSTFSFTSDPSTCSPFIPYSFTTLLPFIYQLPIHQTIFLFNHHYLHPNPNPPPTTNSPPTDLPFIQHPPMTQPAPNYHAPNMHLPSIQHPSTIYQILAHHLSNTHPPSLQHPTTFHPTPPSNTHPPFIKHPLAIDPSPTYHPTSMHHPSNTHQPFV